MPSASSFESTSSLYRRVYSASLSFVNRMRAPEGASFSYTRPFQPLGWLLDMATALGSDPLLEKLDVSMFHSLQADYP